MSDKFADWLAREIPPGTVISDPLWWAPRIERALEGAQSALIEQLEAEKASLAAENERLTAENTTLRTMRHDDGLQFAKDRAALLARAEAAERDADRLRALLLDAAEDLAGWGSYASEYFQDKHCLDADIKKHRDAARGAT